MRPPPGNEAGVALALFCAAAASIAASAALAVRGRRTSRDTERFLTPFRLPTPSPPPSVEVHVRDPDAPQTALTCARTCEAAGRRPLSPLEVPTFAGSTGRSCRCAAGASPVQPLRDTRWTCVAGVAAPVRASGGDVECMSWDGVDCAWTNNPHECATIAGALPSGVESPVVRCGEAMVEQTGYPGYGDPGHWCQTAHDELSRVALL